MGADRSASVAGAVPAELLSRLQAQDRLAALRRLWVQTHIRWLVGILLVSLVLRLVWVLAVQPDPRDGRFDDSVWYYHTARLLAQGEGYVVPGDAFCAFGELYSGGIGCDERPPTALWGPGYPLILSAFFWLPGDNVAGARGLNIAAGLVLVAGVYYLGQRLWDRRAGLLAAGLMAFFPSYLFFSSLVLTETLFTAVAVGLLCLAAAWTLEREVSPRRVFLLGIAAAALAMVRPEGIILVAVIVGAWLLVHRSWRLAARYAALLALGAALIIVPWGIRNAIQLHSPIFGTTGLGQVLLQAHSPAADGQPEFLIVAEVWGRHKHLPFPEREVRVNNSAVREALSWAVHHPGKELGLIPDRFAALYRGDRGALTWNQVPSGDGTQQLSSSWADRWRVVSDAYYYVVLGVAVLALPLWLRRMQAKHFLLWGPIVVYSVMWSLLFTGDPRYHVPLLPLFALLAAIGLAALTQRWTPALRPTAPQSQHGE